MVPLAFFSHFFSLFSVCSFWLFEKKRFSLIMLCVAIACAYITSVIDNLALFISCIYLLATYTFYKLNPSVISRFFLSIMIFVLAWILADNMITGFKTWEIIQNEIISSDGARYSLNLYFDKVIAGLGLLIFGITPLRRVSHIKTMLLSMMPGSIMSIITVASLGMLLGVVAIDLKFPDIWIVWIAISLLVNSVAEEVIFRFYLQGGISRFLEGNPFAGFISISVASMAFTIYHAPNSTNFLASVFLASLFFGYVYHKTKRIESAILLHFITNTIHFFVFTYPFINA